MRGKVSNGMVGRKSAETVQIPGQTGPKGQQFDQFLKIPVFPKVSILFPGLGSCSRAVMGSKSIIVHQIYGGITPQLAHLQWNGIYGSLGSSLVSFCYSTVGVDRLNFCAISLLQCSDAWQPRTGNLLSCLWEAVHHPTAFPDHQPQRLFKTQTVWTIQRLSLLCIDLS